MIKNEFPPNIEELKKYFPIDESTKPFFSYGEIVYNPFGVDIPDDYLVHESVHAKQQGNDIEGWWTRYLNDIPFRIEQEVEAYGTQLSWIKNNDPIYINKRLESFAFALSGELYQAGISFQEAQTMIRRFSKNNP